MNIYEKFTDQDLKNRKEMHMKIGYDLGKITMTDHFFKYLYRALVAVTLILFSISLFSVFSYGFLQMSNLQILILIASGILTYYLYNRENKKIAFQHYSQKEAKDIDQEMERRRLSKII